jgi:hypothetical protein
VRHTLLIFFFAVGFALGAYAQKAGSSGYCLMRVFDVNKFAASGNGLVSAKVIITYETGGQRTVGLQPYNEKAEPDNLKVVVATLNKLKQKGYLLMSANSTEY